MSIKASLACIVRSSLVQETTLAISAISAHMGEPANLTAAFKNTLPCCRASPARRYTHPAGHAPWTRFAAGI
jgi:hypothetical protein